MVIRIFLSFFNVISIPLDLTDLHPICGISPWFSKISSIFFKNILEKYPKSKAYPGISIYWFYMISFAFDRDFHWL